VGKVLASIEQGIAEFTPFDKYRCFEL